MRKKEIKSVYILTVDFLLLFLIFFFVLRLFCCSYFTLAKIHIAFSPLIFIPFLSFFTPTLSVSVCLLSLCLSLSVTCDRIVWSTPHVLMRKVRRVCSSFVVWRRPLPSLVYKPYVWSATDAGSRGVC